MPKPRNKELLDKVNAVAAIQIDWPSYSFDGKKLSYTTTPITMGKLLALDQMKINAADRSRHIHRYTSDAHEPLINCLRRMRQDTLATFKEDYRGVNTSEVEAFFDGRHPERDKLDAERDKLRPADDDYQDPKLDKLLEKLDHKYAALPDREKAMGQAISDACFDTESKERLAEVVEYELVINMLEKTHSMLSRIGNSLGHVQDFATNDCPAILLENSVKSVGNTIGKLADGVELFEHFAYGGEDKPASAESYMTTAKRMAGVSCESLRTLEIALEKSFGAKRQKG